MKRNWALGRTVRSSRPAGQTGQAVGFERCEVSSAKSVEIYIAGQRYVIKTDADPRYIEELAQYIEKRYNALAEARSAKSPQKIAIFTALQLADELFRKQKELDGLKKNIRLKSQKILGIIEEQLERKQGETKP